MRHTPNDDSGSTSSNVVNPNDLSSFSEPESEEILEDFSWGAPSSGLGCDDSSIKTETLGRDGSEIHFSRVVLSELSLLTVTTDVSMQNSISAIYRSILWQP